MERMNSFVAEMWQAQEEYSWAMLPVASEDCCGHALTIKELLINL
jgi:hypothetical protein